MSSWDLSEEYEEHFHSKISSKLKRAKPRKNSRIALSVSQRDKKTGKAKRCRRRQTMKWERINHHLTVEKAATTTTTTTTHPQIPKAFSLWIPGLVWEEFDLRLHDDRTRAYFRVLKNGQDFLPMFLREDILRHILRHDAKYRMSALFGSIGCPLFYLLQEGTTPNLLKVILKCGVTANSWVLNQFDVDDWRLLGWVLNSRKRRDNNITFHFVRMLLQFGADPNAIVIRRTRDYDDFQGYSPLRCALGSFWQPNWDTGFKIRIIKLLLDFGVDLNETKDFDHHTRFGSVLMFPEFRRSPPSIVKFLLQSDARLMRPYLDRLTRGFVAMPFFCRSKSHIFPSYLLDDSLWCSDVFWNVWSWEGGVNPIYYRSIDADRWPRDRRHRSGPGSEYLQLGYFEGTFLELWVRCRCDELARDFATKMSVHVDAFRKSSKEWDCALPKDCVQVVLDMVFDCAWLNELML